jgi:hypothetical protein
MKKKTTGKTEVAIMLGLSKGEGEWPEVSNMTQGEIKDPRRFCNFALNLDDGLRDAPKANIINSVTIIYDGVTRIPSPSNPKDREYDFGLWVENGELTGKIRPVLLFELSEPVDLDMFKRYVWGSSYTLCPTAQEEPFYSEDWNGYTSILEPDELAVWIEHLKKNKAYCGKSFTPNKLANGIPALKLQENSIKKTNPSSKEGPC